MRYLIYVSQAAKPMGPEELAAILAASREHNRADGITGLLVYRYSPAERRGNFMQLLEGDGDRVEAAFARISADDRHHTKVVLERGGIAARNFADWSMGFRDAAAADLAGFDGFADLGSDAFWERVGGGAVGDGLKMMKSFYEEG